MKEPYLVNYADESGFVGEAPCVTLLGAIATAKTKRVLGYDTRVLGSNYSETKDGLTDDERELVEAAGLL